MYAWTDDGAFMGCNLAVLPILKSPKCFTILKSSRPGHPLYKSKDPEPIPLLT